MGPKFKKRAMATASTSTAASGSGARSVPPPAKATTSPSPTVSGQPNPNPRVIYWFRTDLRLHDSPGLKTALSLDPSSLIPLWIWDSHYVQRYGGSASTNRWRFLLESMADLSASLARLNPNQKLHVVRGGPPAKIMPVLLKKWKINVLVFEKDTDAYARARDEQVTQLAEAMGVKVLCVPGGRTLFDSDDIVRANGGKPTLSMTQFMKAAGRLGSSSSGRDCDKGNNLKPNRPLDPPTWLPDPLATEEMSLEGLVEGDSDGFNIIDDHAGRDHRGPPDGALQGLLRTGTSTAGEEAPEFPVVGLMGPDGAFSIPTLREIGIEESDSEPEPELDLEPASAESTHFDPSKPNAPLTVDPTSASARNLYRKGGETTGLALLAHHISDETYIATFEKPLTAPTAFDPPATTMLSPHMHFGSVSVRRFWWAVQDVLEQRRRRSLENKMSLPISPHPVNLPGQLLFRDMYFAAYAAVGAKFGQAVGNPVARFVPWDLQSEASGSSLATSDLLSGRDSTATYMVSNPQAEEYFRRWKYGCTGFPWIDALMRQLRQEGWIHHLGRHAVASFLTRGGCYVSWERGAEVFEEWLLDHEVACNAGNWMWLSCVAFFSQFHRVYSPVSFPKKWDPEGNFVRRYVPELAAFDAKYIYEPWKAPVVDQKRWRCLVKGVGEGVEWYMELGGKKYNEMMHTTRDQAVGDGKTSGGRKGISAVVDDESRPAPPRDGPSTFRLYPKPMFDFNERRQFCIDKMKQAYDIGLYGNDKRVLSGKWKTWFGIDNQLDNEGHSSPQQKRKKATDEAHGPIEGMFSKAEAKRATVLAQNTSIGTGSGTDPSSVKALAQDDLSESELRGEYQQPSPSSGTLSPKRNSKQANLGSRSDLPGDLETCKKHAGSDSVKVRGIKRRRSEAGRKPGRAQGPAVADEVANHDADPMSRFDEADREHPVDDNRTGTHKSTEAQLELSTPTGPTQRTAHAPKQQTLDTMVTRSRSRQV
ncbi:(6-4)DNA photolyase [Exophiala dermatitidis]